MHDLQTIVRLNGPVNQRAQALAKAYKIASDVKSEPVPKADRVKYALQESTSWMALV